LEKPLHFFARFLSVAVLSIIFSSIVVVLGTLLLLTAVSLAQRGSIDALEVMTGLLAGSVLTWFAYLPATIALSIVVAAMFAVSANISWIWSVGCGAVTGVAYLAYLQSVNAGGNLAPNRSLWSACSLILTLMVSALLTWRSARQWQDQRVP
jgi:hypothetical protein